MDCPSCLQTVENHLSRCPFCQASLQGQLPKVSPPRAVERELAAEAALRAGLAQRSVRALIAWMFATVGRILPRPLRRAPHPELWLTLLIPGLGHLFLGWIGMGLFIMAASATMLTMLVVLALDPFGPDTTYHLFWFGLILGGIHSHAVVLADREAPGRAAFSALTLNVIIILTLIAQLNLLGWALWGARYRMNIRGIQLAGYVQAFGPIFRTGDFLDVQPVSSGNLQRGELVMIDQYTLDRVLGLEGDVLKILDRKVLRNGNPLPGQEQPVVPYNPDLDIPYVIAQTPITGERQALVVRSGEAGILYWGRHLRTVPIRSLPGRIEGILAPQERACRFVDGVRVNR